MNKILAKIDSIIDKIPIHVRDLLQKVFFAIVALAILIAIVTGVKNGIEHAAPGGVHLFDKNKDLFFIQNLREENATKNRLIEDVDVYQELFESRDERLHPTFQRLGLDTDDRIIGEREEFIKKDDPLKRKDTELLIEDREGLTEDHAAPDNIKSLLKPEQDSVPLIETPDSISTTTPNTHNKPEKELNGFSGNSRNKQSKPLIEGKSGEVQLID